MAHKSEVALHGRVYRVEVDQPGLVLFRYVAHTCLHFLDRLSCRFAVPRIDSAAHEGDPALDESDRGFAVQFEVQDFVQILLDRSSPPVQCGRVRILLLLKEQPGNSQILEIGVICIDGQKYPEEAWIDVTGKLVEL